MKISPQHLEDSSSTLEDPAVALIPYMPSSVHEDTLHSPSDSLGKIS
jgi:hypothetical protein